MLAVSRTLVFPVESVVVGMDRVGAVSQPVRTCLGCRQRAHKAELVRLVWDSTTGAVVIDAGQVLPGRGGYVHPTCGDALAKRRQLGRALRRPVDAEQAAAQLAALTDSND